LNPESYSKSDDDGLLKYDAKTLLTDALKKYEAAHKSKA